jgi:hypothetical protein
MQHPRYPDCAVPGCGLATNGYSRYCRRHEARFYRTRSPHGRILRKGADLRPHRELAASFLERHGEHAATLSVLGYFDSLIGRYDRRRELRAHLKRLDVDGATAEGMLIKVAAVWLYTHFNERTFPDDIVATVNIGHHALHTVPLPRRNGTPLKFKGSTALALGREIREAVGVYFYQMAEAIGRELSAPQRRKEELRAALGVPFGEPLLISTPSRPHNPNRPTVASRSVQYRKSTLAAQSPTLDSCLPLKGTRRF